VLLFYALLRRLQRHTGFALLGALAYTLFSADTTQAFLTHSLGLQPSLTLLLLSLHSWLSDRRVLSYLLAFVILFAYESPFPVFLAAPLLDSDWDASLVRKAVRHTVVVGLLLGAAAMVKAMAGEERVTGLGVADILLTPLNHMVVGPAASFATFALRPLEVIVNLRAEVLVAVGVALVVFSWVLTREDIGPSSALADSVAWIRSRVRETRDAPHTAIPPGKVPAPLQLRLAAAGLAMWVLAYPLTFTTLGYHIRGRPTRVHLAAVVGASLVVASVGTAAVRSVKSRAGRRRCLIGVAAWLALLAGYGFVLQRDYVRAWELEKGFWVRLLPLVQDAGQGSVILVDPAGIADTYQIAANTWNLPRVLEQLYTIPAGWTDPPRVYRLTENWADTILDQDGKFVLNETTTVAPPSLYGSFLARQVILIETEGGQWTRRLGALTLGARTVTLEPGKGTVLDSAGHSELYNLLIGSTGADSGGAKGRLRRMEGNGPEGTSVETRRSCHE
ncbi:MAG TPA: hypothetical protein VLD63_14700, partial [Anaerolineales bacterium]|nr:hypothetical protein [Anaerolineales bacterium]